MLRGEATLPPRVLTFHYPNYAFHKQNRLGSAIRRGDYKLIHFYDDDSVELYDLRHDLSETTNLADSLPAVAADLRTALTQQLTAEGANLPTWLPTAEREP
jgi:arylsulfatase A